MRSKIYDLSLLILVLLIIFSPSTLIADEAAIDGSEQASNELLNEFKEGFNFRMSIFLYANILTLFIQGGDLCIGMH